MDANDNIEREEVAAEESLEWYIKDYEKCAKESHELQEAFE